MRDTGAKIVLLIGFLMFVSPIVSYLTYPGSLLITVPSSLYGLLTFISGYISFKDDKWSPVALVIAVVGVLLTLTAFLMAWLSQTSDMAGALFWITLAIICFMDLTLFTLVTKMEVFNYFDEE